MFICPNLYHSQNASCNYIEILSKLLLFRLCSRSKYLNSFYAKMKVLHKFLWLCHKLYVKLTKTQQIPQTIAYYVTKLWVRVYFCLSIKPQKAYRWVVTYNCAYSQFIRDCVYHKRHDNIWLSRSCILALIFSPLHVFCVYWRGNAQADFCREKTCMVCCSEKLACVHPYYAIPSLLFPHAPVPCLLLLD